MATGIVVKIDEPKVNSWQSGVFIRIYFKMGDGTWGQTDVVPTFRNYVYWKPIIESGPDTKVENLAYKTHSKLKGKIDADCKPRIVEKVAPYDNKQSPLL